VIQLQDGGDDPPVRFHKSVQRRKKEAETAVAATSAETSMHRRGRNSQVSKLQK